MDPRRKAFSELSLDRRHLSLSSLQKRLFQNGVAVAWKLVAAAILRSLETVINEGIKLREEYSRAIARQWKI